MNDQLINLTKQVKITLEKRKAPTIVTQVGVAFDISGSTQSFYIEKSHNANDSYIQKLVNRMFAIAVTFDDNEALNTWVFDSASSQTTDIIQSNYETYVYQHILQNSKIHRWGSTDTAKVIAAINKYYICPEDGAPKVSRLKKFFSFGKKKTTDVPEYSDPAYILLITDGESDDDNETTKAIALTQNNRIYWQLVGIDNGSQYTLLKHLAATYKNVSYELISPTTTSDADLYDKLISPKFVDWYSTLPK